MNDITSHTSLAFLGILLILVSIGAPAQAQTVSYAPTGTDLLNKCKFSAQYYDDVSLDRLAYGLHFNCVGKVHGVTDALEYFDIVTLPDDTSTEDLVRIVIKYLQDHPEELNERDTLLVVKALRKRFPFKKGQHKQVVTIP